ncbi:hypothetical protein SAMN05660653_03161 [Desulfonatronum thiosulfatophilum]|uniref:Uncharacterized protein n=1 Tax=Desulfonatronum thiosulfatophilum TaxID=617002 RepID=A0A1G6EUF5_9BACT|nr:hypothetical protein [Desulfonatronum thiosulfatophilum]SDB61028.1 hypothetical protein SAMN05660653_03161 [Desulfonatronum thiosulfatophilum]
MFSLLKRLFGGSPQPAKQQQESNFRKNVEFLIVDRGEEIPKNKWYRISDWKSQHFLVMETDWDKDWKCFAREEKVVGVTHEERDVKFLRLFDQPDFKIYLEKDLTNKYDPYAVKVMGSAMIDGNLIVEQLGFLSKDISKDLKDENELDARPHSVYLPVQGNNYGLRINILTRSQRYKNKVHGKQAKPIPKKDKNIPPQIMDKEEENFQTIYDEFEDFDFRDYYGIKKPSEKMIKQAVTILVNEGMLQDDIYDQIERVVEKLIEIKPDLKLDH